MNEREWKCQKRSIKDEEQKQKNYKRKKWKKEKNEGSKKKKFRIIERHLRFVNKTKWI